MSTDTTTRVFRVRWHWLYYALYAAGLHRLGFNVCVQFEETSPPRLTPAPASNAPRWVDPA